MQQWIASTEAYVKAQLQGAEGGHDWWHVYRVWQLSKRIAIQESADTLTVELSALLHDIADAKFHDGDEELGPARATAFLEQLGVDTLRVAHIGNIIRYMSYKGGHNDGAFYSPEFAVVRDADRLDAIGAIGIARTFNYGGFRNRALYDPAIPPQPGMSKEAYKNSTAPTLNHFYEKLLLLKDGMLTATGKQLAAERHAYMEAFVDRFKAEWEGLDG
jgi:uncharacterized protein